MALPVGGGGDPWRVTPEERAKHEEQFVQLKPINGFITGEQAKGFLMQSQLPPMILGQIWALADMNADGKMDKNEFSVAMKLIQMKLKGFEVPKALPPSLKIVPIAPMGMMGAMQPAGMNPPTGTIMPPPGRQPAGGMVGVRPLNAGMMGCSPSVGAMPPHSFPQSQFGTASGLMTNGSAMMSHGVMGAPMMPPSAVTSVGSMGSGFGRSASPVDAKTQRSGSVTSQDSPTGSVGSPLQEWAIPHPSKLRYTQVFNTNDRTRTGFLTGPQARNILMQSGLPQNILAQIWSLSDIDNDGKLTCEEFCVAMHLADSVRAGDKLPTVLPPELVPPSYRRIRSSSIQGGKDELTRQWISTQVPGPPAAGLLGDLTALADAKDAEEKHRIMMATFEDKRRENFEKGQAELEKRRQALLESQRREQEERERKDREEQERRERIRQEQERRRQMELEKQLAKQRELEQEKEEQRRKAMEQREAARREMERQRQLEWEKQRRQELMTQRQKEQERVLQLKAKNQTLTIELEQLNEKVKELNSKLSDARNGVNNLKGVIDQMRSTRDAKVTEMKSLQNETKNQNQKLYLLNQEKTLLQNQMKSSGTGNPTVESYNIVMQSFNNKHITLNQLREKLSTLEKETSQKLQDIDNNNSELKDLKTQLADLISEGEKTFDNYVVKRQEVMELRKQKGLSMGPARPPQPGQAPAEPAAADNAWADNTWDTTAAKEDDQNAWPSTIDAFDERKASIPSEQTQTAPSAWGSDDNWAANAQPPADWGPSLDDAWPATTDITAEDGWPEEASAPADQESQKMSEADLTGRMIKYRALYTFEARNADELSIEPGDIIMVPEGLAHEPGWLGGEFRGKTGWFPEAYVERLDGESEASNEPLENGADGSPTSITGLQETVHIVGTEMKMTLTGIQEAPENSVDNGFAAEVAAQDTQGSAFVPIPKSTAVDTASPVPGQAEPCSFCNDCNEPLTVRHILVDCPVYHLVLVRCGLPVDLTYMQLRKGTSVEGLQAQALFPWRAKKENHLTFNKGDVITVKEQQDMWWYGELDGKAGWFPKSYVKLIAGPRKGGEGLQQIDENAEAVIAGEAVTPVTEYHEAMYAYLSNEAGDLSFNQGDVIMVTKKDGDWWTGIIGERVGVFPSNYVKLTERQTPEEYDPSKLEDVDTMEVDVPDSFDDVYVVETTDEGADVQETMGEMPDVVPQEVVESAEEPQEVPVVEEPVLREDASDAARLQAPFATIARLSRALPPTPIQIKREAPEPPRSPKVRGGKKPEIAMVIAPYAASGPEQLNLQRGQLIHIRKKSANGWWEGELQAKGKKRQLGWFPASYVKQLSSSARNTPEPGQEQVIAMYPYDAQNEDELSFQKAAVITLLSKDDGAWWKGECNGIVGLFPANYVQSSDKTIPGSASMAAQSLREYLSLEPTERKRQESIRELINTEQNYFDDMAIVLDAFYRPLKEAKVCTDQELDIIFVNWKELIACNDKLLKAFRVRKKMNQNGVLPVIGDILCETLPHLTPYIRFCSCQLNAAALIQNKTENVPEFKDVAKGCCKDPRTKGMPLSSFLLKPMQRITKYPLLIKKIIEYTPINHPDRQQLEDALAKAEELCNQVNEGVREKENSDRLEWMQQHIQCDGLVEKITFNSLTNSLGPRKFLHSGTLYKAKSNKELAAFLFNDFLLLTQPVKQLGSVTSLVNFDKSSGIQIKIYKQPLFLNEIMVKPHQDAEDENHFQISHIDRTYNLKASSSTERTLWLKKLDEASRHYMSTERKKREKAHSMRAQRTTGVGRLLVVVVEGVNLKAKSNVRRRPPAAKIKVTVLEADELMFNKSKGRSDPYCEVSMGSQEHRTKVISDTINPKWNSNMQFIVKDVKQDVLCITVFDRDYFSPNDFLGRTEIRVIDILNESKHTKEPIVKKLLLYEVDSGEVMVKLDLQLFESQ